MKHESTPCGNPECIECYGTEEFTEEQIEALNEYKFVEDNIGSVSDVTRTLICQLIERDTHGRMKYGTTLDRTDLTLTDWLQHQSEELMDGAGYALAAKREAEKLLRTRAAGDDRQRQ